MPQKQTGGGVSGLWRHDWANREYIQQEADFPQTKVFDAGCAFIHKNHAEDNWLLQVETFDPHEPFHTTQEYLSLYEDDWSGPHYDWPRGRCWKATRPWSISAAAIARWCRCAIATWGAFWT
ncbi:hypothetical protein ECZU34_49520 [Escherichia coli]|nr:hypothetical protein ECZU34_49520 [Escherichia coli]